MLLPEIGYAVIVAEAARVILALATDARVRAPSGTSCPPLIEDSEIPI
jgi:hypothetical protein